MAFASGLSLADLSDYLAPSQACIMPVSEVTTSTPIIPLTEAELAFKKTTSAATEIIIDSENGYHEINLSELGDIRQKLKKAEITIEDCLACSGCVTSEESVLVAMQSDEEVYRVLRDQPNLVPVISFSPQSLASLAALHDLSIEETFRGLRAFFKRELGFKLVFDITFARSISLLENRREFLERKSHSLSPSPFTTPSSLPPLSPYTSPMGPLPILSSACPGWICLAEKKHSELLEFVSNVKSGQAIMGTLVKRGEVARRLGLRPQDIYHVSVMPCFDKKLEASRLDFTSPSILDDQQDVASLESIISPSTSTTSTTSTNSTTINSTTGVRDVDCVLTTGEVQKMLNSRGLNLVDLAASGSSSRISTSTTSTTIAAEIKEEIDITGSEESLYFPELLFNPGTSSGGYLFNVIESSLEDLELEELYRTKIVEKKLKNEDHISFTVVTFPSTSSTSSTNTNSMDLDLSSSSSSLSPSTSTSTSLLTPKIQLRAAKCYGLHNLQNLTRKVASDASLTPLTSTSSSYSNSNSNSIQDKMASNRSIASAKVAAMNAKRLAARKLKFGEILVSSSSSSLQGEIEYEKLKYDFVEVMACPSGCVNGGGQIRIPIEPMKLHRRILRKNGKENEKGKGKGKKVRVDHEGMLDFSERLEDHDEEMEMEVDVDVDVEEEGKGEEGKEEKKVFTGKEWVGRVEEVYWEIGKKSSMLSHRQDQAQAQDQETNPKRNLIDWSRIDPSILPYLLHHSINQGLNSLIEVTIEDLVKGIKSKEGKEEMRRELFRTSYRAVEGQTNGFAVEW